VRWSIDGKAGLRLRQDWGSALGPSRTSGQRRLGHSVNPVGDRGV